MSRHKLVKAMNWHDELDDFDGGNDHDYDLSNGTGERMLVNISMPMQSS